MLREVLIQTELLTPAEMSLATIQLKHVEELMVVESEANRLRSASSRQQQSEEQAVETRLATVEAENRRLQSELAEAEEKLEAITSDRALDPRAGISCSRLHFDISFITCQTDGQPKNPQAKARSCSSMTIPDCCAC